MSTAVNGFEKLKTEYESCLDFHEIYAELKDGTTREVDGFVLHDGYLFIGHKLRIPRASLREFLFGNACRWPSWILWNEKTIETVEYRFYWPNLKRRIAKHVGRCYICQLAKQ